MEQSNTKSASMAQIANSSVSLSFSRLKSSAARNYTIPILPGSLPLTCEWLAAHIRKLAALHSLFPFPVSHIMDVLMTLTTWTKTPPRKRQTDKIQAMWDLNDQVQQICLPGTSHLPLDYHVTRMSVLCNHFICQLSLTVV